MLTSHIFFTNQGGHLKLSHSQFQQIYNIVAILNSADPGLPYGEDTTSFSGNDFRKKKGLIFLVGTTPENAANSFEIYDCSFSNCIFNPILDSTLISYTASLLQLQYSAFILEKSVFTNCSSFAQSNASIVPMIHLYNVLQQSVIESVNFTDNAMTINEVTSASPVLTISNGTFKGKWINLYLNDGLPVSNSLLSFNEVSGTRLNYLTVQVFSKFEDGAFATNFSNCQASTISNCVFAGCGNHAMHADVASQHYIVMKNMCFEKLNNIGDTPILVKVLYTDSCPLNPALFFSSLITATTLSYVDRSYAIVTIVVFLLLFVVAFGFLVGMIFVRKGNHVKEQYGPLSKNIGEDSNAVEKVEDISHDEEESMSAQ